ncbi:MAG: SDR family NAD(P)-dependent oxidoreductase, partial [Actinomycetes bacterium]
MMDLGLAGRVYVVSAGSRGLGFAGAQALVEQGARVVISGRNHGRIKDAVQELGGHSVAVDCPL